MGPLVWLILPVDLEPAPFWLGSRVLALLGIGGNRPYRVEGVDFRVGSRGPFGLSGLLLGLWGYYLVLVLSGIGVRD
jgi:hypothetical protein